MHMNHGCTVEQLNYLDGMKCPHTVSPPNHFNFIQNDFQI